MNYKECIEKLTLYFSEEKYMPELIEAKELFFNQVGVDSSEEYDFETKHDVFFDWYLLSRPLNGTIQTPAQLALDLDTFDHSTQKEMYKNLSESRLSLYEFLKEKNNEYQIRDVLTREKVTVKNSSLKLIAEKGDYFHTHLISDDGDNSFSNSVVFHDSSAKKIINNAIKTRSYENDEDRKKLVLDLIKAYFKLQKYPHVGIESIYKPLQMAESNE